MILRLLASVLLVVASFGATSSPVAAAQDVDDPATAVSDETSEADSASDEASNLPGLLIGAVLLGAGGWAYLNKKQRFPGAQFRD